MSRTFCSLRRFAVEASHGRTRSFHQLRLLGACVAVIATTSISTSSSADEGGVSFWFPGLYGSLAAVPQVPGWAVGIIDIYNPVSAGGNVAAARQVTINGF